MTENSPISKVLAEVNLVVYKTRIVTPIRDTGEGKKEGSRIEKVLQSCFDPKALRALNTKKQEAMRICRSFGTKVDTLNAWAVPKLRTEELMDSLARISQEWDVLASDLAKSIDIQVNAWANANPSEASMILALAPSSQDVLDTTKFIFTSYRLRSEDVEDNGCLEADLASLPGQAMHEFAVALKDASLDKATGAHYTQGIKDVLERIVQKAESFAFLDPRISEVVSVIQNTLKVLPSSGAITDAHAVLVKSVIDQMLNPQALLRNGFRKIESSKPDDELSSIGQLPLSVPGLSLTDRNQAIAW